jgi:hypothetical protein
MAVVTDDPSYFEAYHDACEAGFMAVNDALGVEDIGGGQEQILVLRRQLDDLNSQRVAAAEAKAQAGWKPGGVG